ncbi:MAG: hypothetical protein LUQ44_07765 [Methanothrix sp.]|nr:hypothetical protein [Methanothrix sp.]
MMMQREEKIVFVLLLMALGSLAVAFWAFAPDDSGNDGLSNSKLQEWSDPEVSISVEGLVQEIKPTKSGGHILVTIDSTPLPIFVTRQAGAEKILGVLKRGDRLWVRGMQKDYQGQEEIEVTRPSDVKII